MEAILSMKQAHAYLIGPLAIGGVSVPSKIVFTRSFSELCLDHQFFHNLSANLNGYYLRFRLTVVSLFVQKKIRASGERSLQNKSAFF